MNWNSLLTLLKGSNNYDTVVKILNLAAGFLVKVGGFFVLRFRNHTQLLQAK
jgi:hypothetical protein